MFSYDSLSISCWFLMFSNNFLLKSFWFLMFSYACVLMLYWFPVCFLCFRIGFLLISYAFWWYPIVFICFPMLCHWFPLDLSSFPMIPAGFQLMYCVPKVSYWLSMILFDSDWFPIQPYDLGYRWKRKGIVVVKSYHFVCFGDCWITA
jgi:hypothetical protein